MALTTFLNKNREQIESLLPIYIAQQRWFGGKSHTVISASIASTTPVGDDAVIALIEIAYPNSTDPDLYQLPLALATNEQSTNLQSTNLQSTAPKSIIATLEGNTLFDASADPTFQQSLLHKITNAGAPRLDSETWEDGATNLLSTRSSALNPTRFTDLPSRLSSAEQSNTSILYEPLAILKLFRHLRPGAENPDVEIARFLTETAHFNGIPTYLGDLHRASDSTTLAFLQAFAPNEGDGWAWTLAQLEGFFHSAANVGAPYLDSEMWASDSFKPSLEAATLIGRRTAELHLALATPTRNSAFAAEPYTTDDLIHDHQRIAAQINAALDQLSAAVPSLAYEVATNAQELLSQRQQLLTKIHDLSGDPATFGHRIRIHGDYHLGQLLRTSDDFLIVDFEGEPARSLAERRQKQSPLRDVAGMLRSFSYAAHTGLVSAVQLHTADTASLKLWATAWETAISTAFLHSYNETISTQPNLTPAHQQTNTLLNALLLEKALYELLYELNNRPAWLPIPLEGLLELTRQ